MLVLSFDKRVQKILAIEFDTFRKKISTYFRTKFLSSLSIASQNTLQISDVLKK